MSKKGILIIIFIIILFIFILIGGGILTFGNIFEHFENQGKTHLYLYISLVLIFYLFFFPLKLPFNKIGLYSAFILPFFILMPISYIERRHAHNITNDAICIITKAIISDYDMGKNPKAIISFHFKNKKISKRLKTKIGNQTFVTTKKLKDRIGDSLIIQFPIYSNHPSFIIIKNGNPTIKALKAIKTDYFYFNKKYYNSFNEIPLSIRMQNYEDLINPIFIKQLNLYKYKY